MSAFLENLVADLRAFATDMLETGLAPATHLDLEDVRAPSMAALTSAIQRLTALVPALLGELEHEESPNRVTRLWSPSPVRGTPSRRACDFQRIGNRGLVPTRWVRDEPVRVPNVGALAWLLHLLELQREHLGSIAERTRKQIDEARLARRGTSSWAMADAAGLDSIEAALDHAEMRLRRATGRVRAAAGRALSPSRRLPSPYPRSPGWARLRMLARDLTEPGRALPAQLRIMLSGAPETADIPYLYQRWCGVKLLQAFEDLGWQITTEPVGPLLLGGCIRLRRRGLQLDLWVEARLTAKRDHPSGFQCTAGREATPDFLLVAKGPSRFDAFVLDATMTTDREVILEKGKYLDVLRSASPGYAAGLEVYYRPRRSWAAAPLQGGVSRIFNPSGEWGVVPMNPARWHADPLRAWVLDIDRYARAWASVEDDPRFRSRVAQQRRREARRRSQVRGPR